MKFYDTLVPYKTIKYKGIHYTVCRDYSHISRYRGLRQVVFMPDDPERFTALETANAIISNKLPVKFHTVTVTEENRLDLIAYKELGSVSYAWVIAYMNRIVDGYTVHEGQRLTIPINITSLFSKGELLAPVSPSALNLGSE